MSTPTLINLPGYAPGTWDLDPAHSYVGFVVRHLVVTKVRGRFDDVSGHLVTEENPLESSVEVSVDLSSVNTSNEFRDNHLRSTEFFDVASFPRMTFRSTGIRQDGDDVILDGDLTVKDTTRPLSLSFEFAGITPDPWGGTRIGFSATGELNRKDFNVNFEGLQNGVALVSDKVEIVIDVQATLRQAAPAR